MIENGFSLSKYLSGKYQELNIAELKFLIKEPIVSFSPEVKSGWTNHYEKSESYQISIPEDDESVL